MPARMPYAPASVGGAALGGVQGQKSAPFGRGEWTRPTSAATLVTANRSAVSPKRRSMMLTSAQLQRTAVRMNPLPSRTSVSHVSLASPVRSAGV